MSNEVNIREIGYGTADPGIVWEINVWTDGSEGAYDSNRRKVRAFTVAPDPWIPLGDIGSIEFLPGISVMEIARVFNMVRTDDNGGHVFQWNVDVLNSGLETTAWHLLEAATTN